MGGKKQIQKIFKHSKTVYFILHSVSDTYYHQGSPPGIFGHKFSDAQNSKTLASVLIPKLSLITLETVTENTGQHLFQYVPFSAHFVIRTIKLPLQKTTSCWIYLWLKSQCSVAMKHETSKNICVI